MITIEANALRAAFNFKAKNDVRLVHSNPSNDGQVIVFDVVAPYLPNEIATVMIAPIKG